MDSCQVALSFRAAVKRGRAGSRFGRQPGASRMAVQETTAATTSAAHMTRWVRSSPKDSTSGGVSHADRAVPPMPAPKTPVAKPRRSGRYQAFAKGTPTAKEVPATPRRKPETSRAA